MGTPLYFENRRLVLAPSLLLFVSFQTNAGHANFLPGHLKVGLNRSSCVGDAKEIGKILRQLSDMNRRGDDRIEMQLPCRLMFPSVWSSSLDGFTGNLHRNGVLVACRLKPGRDLPSVGDTATVHIELPPNQNFPPKYIRCDTTLVRIEKLEDCGVQFAMKILNMDFQDDPAVWLDSETCGYIM